jgi:hypothetical protein
MAIVTKQNTTYVTIGSQPKVVSVTDVETEKVSRARHSSLEEAHPPFIYRISYEL